MSDRLRHEFTVKLFNGEEEGDRVKVPVAMVAIDASDVAQWAREMGTIAGVQWETDGSDFAFAILSNAPGLIDRLRSEGYKIDASEFTEARAS